MEYYLYVTPAGANTGGPHNLGNCDNVQLEVVLFKFTKQKNTFLS